MHSECDDNEKLKKIREIAGDILKNTSYTGFLFFEGDTKSQDFYKKFTEDGEYGLPVYSGVRPANL